MSYWDQKVAVVTGGSAGLGRALVETLAANGACVVPVARDAARLDALAERLRAAGGQVAPIAADITRQDQVDGLFAQAVDRFGRLDLLINNAGRSSRGAALATTPDEFRDLLELNFLALVRCTRAAAPHLLNSRGHLVNIGSLAAKSASPYLGAYPASKFPVAAYSHQLRLELGPRGLHVLLVCPGPIAREDAGRRYDDKTKDLPESASRPGGGVKLKGLDPRQLAHRILDACERRRPELVAPGKARWLFAILQLWPALGDRILTRMIK